ncbi:glycosyltransferase family 1 protein [bacterium]|nr:MAG: glycosyltransferase family 1 protein [bacterium]
MVRTSYQTARPEYKGPGREAPRLVPSPGMRVTLEASALLGPPAGMRTYVLELVRRLSAQNPEDLYRLYVGRWAPFPPAAEVWPGTPPPNLALELRRLPFAPVLRLEHTLGLNLQERLLPRADVFHGTAQFLPRLRKTPSVLTLHHWGDMTHQAGSWRRFYYDTAVKQSIRWADRVITVSNFTRDHFLERTGLSPERVRVVPHGVFDPLPSPGPDELAALRRRYGLPPRFALCLSRLNPGKNVVRLVRAFSRLAPRHEGLGLALVGHADAGYLREVRAAVADCRMEARVVLTGPVPDAEVPAFYAACEAFVFPSTSEGFGIPVIEAMAMGRPVAAANATALPETVGGAGALFDPLDEEAIAAGLESVLEGGPRRAELTAKGLARAAQFTWAAAARATRAVYGELA